MSSRILAARLVPGLASILCAFLLPACGSDSGDDDNFVLRTTEHAGSAVQPVEVSGSWLVYLADEGFTGRGGGGTDLNGDLDTLDDVAVVSRISSTSPVVLGVATRTAQVVGDQVYLVVSELEDNKDWSGANGTADVVLLHWSEAADEVTFVDVLDLATNEPILVSEDRLYYCGTPPAITADPDETTIRYLAATAPTTRVAVLNTLGGGPLEAHLLSTDDQLLFLFVDEAGTLDRNADGDMADAHVLALLDGTEPTARLENVEVALQDASAPIDAFKLPNVSDWLVAFLVDEAGQGATNLNANAINPVACLATPDVDASDEVLHFLDVGEFFAGNEGAVNTGIAGRDRVLALAGHVATLADEADASCDLNQDTDTTDTIARWVEAEAPAQPVADDNLLHAVDATLPGGAMGLAQLDGRLVIAVDGEADGAFPEVPAQYRDFVLVAWLDPTLGSPTWHFSHQHPTNPGFGTGIFDSGGDSEPFAGTSWMAKDPVGDRLALTFLEEVPGTNTGVSSLNARTTTCDVETRDSDKLDALPVWADFEAGPTLDFDGIGFAVATTNAGIVIAGNFAFFRVSEAEDSEDYNNDGDETDLILMRNPLTTCGPVAMSISSPFARPVIDSDGERGAAFLAAEANAGTDFNDDGDTNDVVVRYFLF